MIHRPSHMRAHPGQAAFPGGTLDAGETPIEAALREANEELGIDPARVQVIGASDQYRTGTGAVPQRRPQRQTRIRSTPCGRHCDLY
jgi:8-oxo-dGTP pyrophosphatase MutT (NUDIX family)